MKKIDPNKDNQFGERPVIYIGKTDLVTPMSGFIPLAAAAAMVVFSGEENFVFSPLRILIFGCLFLAGLYYILYSYNSFRIEGRTIFINHRFRLGEPLEKSFDDIKLVIYDSSKNSAMGTGSNVYFKIHLHDSIIVTLCVRKKTIWRRKEKDHLEEILDYFENQGVKVIRR